MPPPVTLNSLIEDKLVVSVCAPDASVSEGFFNYGARGMLSYGGLPPSLDDPSHIIFEYDGFRNLTENNGQVMVLHGRSIFALHKKRNFWGLDSQTLLVERKPYLFLMSYWLNRYRRQGILRPLGVVNLDCSNGNYSYLAFVITHTRNGGLVFRSPCLTYTEALQETMDLGGVVLRGYDTIESGGSLRDIDILIADSSTPGLRSSFSHQIGTIALDILTETGLGGFDFKQAPYFLPHFARDILASATIRPSGIRAPSAEYAYLAYMYHLLFHHNSGYFTPNAEMISSDMMRSKDFARLTFHCSEAGVPVPSTITEMEDILKARGYFPSKELLTFYANANPFITSRYFSELDLRPGLSTFFVRGYEGIPDQRDYVREVLGEEYEILCEGEFDEQRDFYSLSRVRGGNWYDDILDKNGAPTHWFCCYDSSPIAPRGDMKRHYPFLDNARNVRVKSLLRTRMPERIGVVMSPIHSSDNSDQAFENMVDLGADDNSEFKRIVSQLSD